MLDVVLRGASLIDRPGRYDIGMSGGLITQVDASIEASALRTVDLDGRLVLPGFVDAHLHLDKAFLEEDPQLRAQTGAQFFDALRNAKRAWTAESLGERMRRALRQAANFGTLSVRAQIDVDEVIGVRGIEAALALKRECSDWIGVQVVAFPQEGLLTNPSAMAHVRQALQFGTDVLGVGAGFDEGRIVAHVDALFRLAVEYDVELDIHADLGTDPRAPLEEWEVWHIARATRAARWQGRVTVAHLTQLGRMSEEKAARVADLLAEAGISVTMVPGAELNTATAWQTPPATDVAETMTRLDVLLNHGVNLSYATGHIADAFNPYGRGDMLLDGLVLACARNLGQPRIAGRHVLDLGTVHPARSLRLVPRYAVASGAAADLVCLDAIDADRALRHHVPRYLSLRAGQPVDV